MPDRYEEPRTRIQTSLLCPGEPALGWSPRRCFLAVVEHLKQVAWVRLRFYTISIELLRVNS
jgi:hypothetical protein